MSDIAPTAIRELLRDFVNAPTWAASQEIVTRHQAVLLTDDADADFAMWMDEVPDVETLAWYREVLRLCGTKGIDATFDALPEPRPLNKALKAFIDADGQDSLLQVIQNFPEITSVAAANALQELIVQKQATDQEAANTLIAHIAMIEMVKLARRPINENLAQLLIDWISADTWEKSQETLKSNAERLLSDEALETLTKLILLETSEEDEDGENEEEDDKTKILLLHRAILEKAREGSIEAAYAELLKPSPLTLALKTLPDELRDAIQAMIMVSSPAELREQIAKHPVLLTEQATAAIDKLLNDLRQEGQEDIANSIEQRYNTLKEAIADAQDPRQKALNALLQADTPVELQQVIAEYPLLLEDETLNQLTTIAARAEQDGNTVVAQQLRLRVGEVRRIQKLKQPAASSGLDQPGLAAQIERVEIRADSGGMAFDTNLGNINQTTIENYTPPTRKWLRPARQALSKTFIGRQDELDTLRENLNEGESVAITGKKMATTVQGMGGIGKTYLARQLAFELYPHFPGGVMWIELGPQVIDEATAQVPLHLLASYAFDGTPPPIGQLQPEQVAAWLQETAPGRLLVIFDDVWHQAPLRFLEQALPPDAVQLITTRYANVAQTLSGKMLILDRLTPEDGLALLEDRLDCRSSTTYTYKADLEALVELLGSHALALDIAASLIKKRPSRVHAVQSVIENLRQGTGRGKLDTLRLPPSEERDENLEKSFALSYERMTAQQQIHFRALGVFAAETPITPEAAASIWGIDDLNAAEKALNDQVDLALLTEIEELAGITYRQHGLLRIYAWALLEKEGELTSASWAHAYYYKNLSVQAETTSPKDYPLLDRHIQNLLAALQWTADNEPDLFSQLIEALSQFLQLRGQLALLETYLPKAVAAAVTVGDKHRQANLLRSLGDLENRLGNIDQARAHYDAALPLYRAERDQLGEANLLRSLGDLERRLGNIDQARAHYDAALPLYRAQRARLGEANVYKRFAEMFMAQKEWTQASTFYKQALPLYVAEREPLGQAGTLIGLGRARFELGDHVQGMQDVQQAALLFGSVRDEEWAHRAESYLNQMRARVEEQSEINQETARALIDFANADWAKRRQLLTDHADLLLSDLVEPVFERLLEAYEEEEAIHELERLRMLLRRCRTWGIDTAWYLALGMRLGDDIDIPTGHEAAVMQIAALLSRQQEDDTALEQAIESMQALLSSLPGEQPGLFRAALLRDLADAMFALPANHPTREID
jgi:Tetratricopeptide repeat/NB-ARC domain